MEKLKVESSKLKVQISRVEEDGLKSVPPLFLVTG
jgi:hypothetical protein